MNNGNYDFLQWIIYGFSWKTCLKQHIQRNFPPSGSIKMNLRFDHWPWGLNLSRTRYELEHFNGVNGAFLTTLAPSRIHYWKPFLSSTQYPLSASMQKRRTTIVRKKERIRVRKLTFMPRFRAFSIVVVFLNSLGTPVESFYLQNMVYENFYDFWVRFSLFSCRWQLVVYFAIKNRSFCENIVSKNKWKLLKS